MKCIIATFIVLAVITINVPATVIKEPIPPKVMDLQKLRELDHPSRGDRAMVFEATAYCYGSVTKTGTSPVEGRTIAVDPKVIPLGSEVQVSCETWPEVDGVYTAEDTGRLVKGLIIDIYMTDRNACIQWGRRTVEVKIID
jgi:3D (Asp-Asp-Asp) domain-containing protein